MPKFIREIKLFNIVILLFLGVTTNIFADTPTDGVYTFTDANQSDDKKTVTTKDGFFIISNSTTSDTAADAYGAYINKPIAETIADGVTSYLEVKVANSGSFYVSKATIGEYEKDGKNATNEFINVRLIGYANDTKVCETIGVDSLGSYDTEYTIDYLPCKDILIDKFRTYFTTKGTESKLADFNLIDFN